MAHRLTTPPTTAILTASDAKAQCRIEDDVEDTYLDQLIARATRYCENLCKRAFITQTWTLTLDGWTDDLYVFDGVIHVPRPPLISLVGSGLGITYLDSDGVSQTLAANQYRVDTQSQPGRIEPAYDVIWPTQRGSVGEVTIVHTAGYGAATAVPDDIKHAVLMMCAAMHENREEFKTPDAVLALLDAYMMQVYV